MSYLNMGEEYVISINGLKSDGGGILNTKYSFCVPSYALTAVSRTASSNHGEALITTISDNEQKVRLVIVMYDADGRINSAASSDYTVLPYEENVYCTVDDMNMPPVGGSTRLFVWHIKDDSIRAI